jgi:hypothetical protein
MSKIVIDIAAIMGPINRPKMPNFIIPARVERTVMSVWFNGL